MHRLNVVGTILFALMLSVISQSEVQAQGPISSALNSSLCIDIPGGSTQGGTKVALWNCHGGWNQQFILQPNGHLQGSGSASNMCLDHYPSGGVNGAPITLWPCHPISDPNDSQRWTLTPTGELRASNGKCIDIYNGEARGGTALILWGCHAGTNQKWNVRSVAQTPRSNSSGPVHGLYVLDGTGAKAVHQNVMWHLYQRFQTSRPDAKYYYEGVGYTVSARDAQSIYDRVYSQICADVRPTSQGGKGVTDVYIAGYSRGAIISVRLAKNVPGCGANVRFLGLMDAVNTSMDERIWPVSVTNVPVAVHIEKPSNHGATVLTTKSIHGPTMVRNPWIGGWAGVGAVTHEGMACPVTNRSPARWNEETLVNWAQRAGARFSGVRGDTNTCSA